MLQERFAIMMQFIRNNDFDGFMDIIDCRLANSVDEVSVIFFSIR